MTLILRQSTAIDIRMGPFNDVGDGFTPETGVTIGAADQAEVLKADGAATVAMAGTLAAVTGCDGWYDYTASTTDTDTVGEIVFVMQDLSVYLPVFVRGQVLEEAVYDAMYAAAAEGPLQGTTAGNTLDVNATGEAGLDLDNTSGTLGAAQIATGAITAAKFATGAVDAAALATDAVDEIADGVWNEDATAHQTLGTFGQAIGDPVANTETIYDAVVTDAAGTNVAADIVAVQADTDNIQTRLPAALVGGAMDSDVSAMQAGSIASGTIAAGELTNIENEIWDALKSAHVVANSFGDFLDIEVSGRATPAEVLTQVNAAIDTAISELSQGVPTATPTLRTGLMLLYMALRNKTDVQTSGTDALEIHSDDGTQIAVKLLTDAGGDYAEAKMTTGV